MSVFLRWGVFGILGFAALLYAYNASKRMAEVRVTRPAPVANATPTNQPAPLPAASEAPVTPATGVPPQPAAPTPAHCEAELVVARRAIEMRKQGEPLDRVLRIQEIAWQESPERRARLETVASRWFRYEGEFRPEALRIAVISDSQQSSPRP